MLSINPKEVSVGKFHNYLLSVVAPRPIAFVSTIDKEGNVNLSPYSFFNAFGANPPIMIFSAARRVRDNTIKHTLENIKEVPEVVVNIANYPIVEQMSLSSTEYAKGVNEFVKSGLTEAKSEIVKPPRVAEAPASFECKVNQIIETGSEGGAGILIVCEVLVAHFQDNILDEEGKVNPFKLDAVGRMGQNWYARINGEALFEVQKPLRTKGIGVDAIPTNIRNSEVLTGNNLGKLGNVEQLPSKEEIKVISKSERVTNILEKYANNAKDLEKALHQLAQEFLDNNETLEAWKVLLVKK